MWDIATDPKMLDNAERRLGPNLVLWHTVLLIKEPGTGRGIPRRQDQVYWDGQRVLAPLANLWIKFDAVDESRRAFSVLSRSQTNGLLPHAHMGDFFGLAIDPSEFPPDAEDREATFRFKDGQAGTHSSYSPHRSSPNPSDHWRRAWGH
jgi:hypothetical protein